MEYQLQEEGEFKFIETEGGKPVLMLLHGLFGALSNFGGIIDHFGEKYNVVVPILPIFEMPLKKVSVTGFVDYVVRFVAYKKYDKVHVLGNSLGGHIALLYSLKELDKIASITLTGSSGLFEKGLGSTFPKRGDYDYIKKKTELTFYSPETASKELVDEVFEIVNNRKKGLRIVYTAKSAIRHNIGDELHELKAPALLIWGKDDTITPPFVAEKFKELLPDTELHFIEKCGHAPMMEHPKQFNKILEEFIVRKIKESN